MARRLVTRIKELRGRAWITQEELARRVGVRRETIVHLEAGRYNPSLRLAHDIAEVFGLRIEEVFTFTDGDGARAESGRPRQAGAPGPQRAVRGKGPRS